MSGWVKPWVLVVACAPLACGSTDNNAAIGVAGAASSGGSATVAAGAGAAGTAGTAGATTINVDPAVSATYSWAECGRIEPGARPVAGLYTPDESVITLEETGRLRLFPSGSPVGVTLIPAHADGHASAALLSADGRWLLAPSPTKAAGLYATEDGSPLGAATRSLVLVASFLASEPVDCPWPIGFSSDSQRLVMRGPESVCVAEIDSGTVLTTVAVAQASAVALRDGATAPLRVFRDNKLTRYALDGTLQSELDVAAQLAKGAPAGKIEDAVFTPNARQLLFTLGPGDGFSGEIGLLIALDSDTGAELWRKPFVPDYDAFTIASDSSVVQMHRGGTFRITDGEQVGTDPKGPFTVVNALGPGGRRELRLNTETLIEWDLQRGKLLRLYGAHTERIRDLDISRDGRFLASHGDWAIVWQLDDDFARSLPLYNGAAPDDSWNVALAADGGILAVSGDNVAFFQPDGSYSGIELPPTSLNASACLSADWSFSPMGSWAAGTRYGNEVVLLQTPTMMEHSRLATANCRGGVAFSPDGSQMVTASLELFDTNTWSRLWTAPPFMLAGNTEHAVQFSPDGQEIAVTRCEENPSKDCWSERRSVRDGALIGRLPGLSGQRARYSPEGHWVISDNDLVHLPSGGFARDMLPEGQALFAPNGDIIAGELDGSLVRYCRSSQ